MEPSLAGGRRSYHQQNQPKYRNKGNTYSNGAALFLQFPPPPNYPPSNDRISFERKSDKKMQRCPNDLDRIEICLEPEQMLSSSPAEPYDKRSEGMGGRNGIGKFHNNVELQKSRYHNISATMERFEPSTSSYRRTKQTYDQNVSRLFPTYDGPIEISHNIPLLDSITAGPSYRTHTPNSMHSLTMNRHNNQAAGTSRHMYTTRYGTQENIYEDIEAEHRLNMLNGGQSMISLPQSVVEEEFRRVETRHRRVLAELNLSTEAMLMPSTPPNNPSTEEQCVNSEQLSDLLQSVELTDELLSPVSASAIGTGDMDSGFSGSSSGASCIGSIRYRAGFTLPTKSPTPMDPCNTSIYCENYRSSKDASSVTYSSRSKLTFHCDKFDHTIPNESSKNKNSFWSRKRWRKLPGLLASGTQKLSAENDEHKLSPGIWDDALSVPNPIKLNQQHLQNSDTRSDPQNPFITIDQEHNKNINNNHLASKHKTPNQKYYNTTQNCRRLEHNSSTRTNSSEDSYWSERANSDNDISSDGEDESDRSVTSVNARNSNLRSTLNKAKHHLSFDKWRGSNSSQSSTSGNVSMQSQTEVSSPGESPGGRLSRWFSIRRGSAHHYDLGRKDCRPGNIEKENKLPATKVVNTNCSSGIQMPQLTETEEDGNVYGREVIAERSNVTGTLLSIRRTGPCLITPTLPPTPAGLSHQQIKRRHIVAAIIHSENSYVATLQRLVNDYKKPLETSSPPILSCSKISTLFHRLPEILQCHTLFRIALADCIRNWDRDEHLGDVFVGSFGKPVVLDIYSGFINNFSSAMELAKMEAKRKSALADFFKVKQISAHDRLSFFGLMVKPVQRFPQFILFLQDLLKYTPQDHHDRMSLQLALTQLESLAEMLNERKREAEQYQAFKEMLGHISGTFNTRSLSSTGNRHRYLLREDNLTQIEFNHSGFIVKSKPRRLLLLNDKVICVSVAPKQSQDFGATEKLSFKWIYPVTDVDIVDSTTSTSLSRILTAGLNRGGSIKSNNSNSGAADSSSGMNGADNLCSEMSNLMHDYEVMSRINDLVGVLKCSYNDLNTHTTKQLLANIQSSIQKKDEEMAWVDSCCLQLVVKNKNGKEETFTFQTENPSIKKEWITELRLAQLALDVNNSPAWEVPEHEQRPSTKMPLFVEAQAVTKSHAHHQTEVRCGCYYTTTRQAFGHRRSRNQNYIWACTSNGTSSHITILLQNHQRAGKLKEVGSFDLMDIKVTSIEFVKSEVNTNQNVNDDTVWIGTDNGELFIYDANNPEQEKQLTNCTTSSAITQILYHLDSVFVALSNGNIQIFRRVSDGESYGEWNLKTSQSVLLIDAAPVSAILPINDNIYAACGRKVWVINGLSGDILKPFDVHHTEGESNLSVNLMAHSGIGLWVSLKSSNIICLYHTETFKHLQDINIASNVLKVTSSRGSVNHKSSIFVTALMACKGLLWVGTNVGISLTIPLPRLEGVPIMSGGVSISYHAHFGPVTFMLPLVLRKYYRFTKSTSDTELPNGTQESTSSVTPETKNDLEELTQKKMRKQNSQDLTMKIRAQLENSPVLLRRRRFKETNDICRLSKTLPRGVGLLSTHSAASQNSEESACDVYGLYGDLIYVKESYESHQDPENLMNPSYENLRRSDPELAAIPGKVSTLDRRLRLKVSRPRSLDLSNWSVESKSSSMYTSSGSEESMAFRHGLYGGKSVSRNSSNASHKTINMSDLMNINEHEPTSPKNHVVPTVTIDPIDSSENLPYLKTSTIKKKKKTGFVEKGNADNNSRQTVVTLTGGRGYINWRHIWCNNSLDKSKSNNSRVLTKVPNSNDAHFIIWEKKV